MQRDRFVERMEELNEKDMEIVRKKNDDYAQSDDALQNFRVVEDMGLMSLEDGICVRLSDKIQRIFNLVGGEDDASVEDETVVDTMRDARNYLRILEIAYEERGSE